MNQVARQLQQKGLLCRIGRPDGKLVNEWLETPSLDRAGHLSTSVVPSESLISEDQVKEAVRCWLVEQGFAVSVAMGRERGIDIEARHPDGRRVILEAKGEVASDQQQGNYFLGALGELLQRMDDPTATYGLALPSNRRYRNLVRRLPTLAKRRLGLVVVWVEGRAPEPAASLEQFDDGTPGPPGRRF